MNMKSSIDPMVYPSLHSYVRSMTSTGVVFLCGLIPMLIDFANEDVLDLALDSASKSGGSVLRNDGKLSSESESEISITLGYFFRACAVDGEGDVGR